MAEKCSRSHAADMYKIFEQTRAADWTVRDFHFCWEWLVYRIRESEKVLYWRRENARSKRPRRRGKKRSKSWETWDTKRKWGRSSQEPSERYPIYSVTIHRNHFQGASVENNWLKRDYEEPVFTPVDEEKSFMDIEFFTERENEMIADMQVWKWIPDCILDFFRNVWMSIRSFEGITWYWKRNRGRRLMRRLENWRKRYDRMLIFL